MIEAAIGLNFGADKLDWDKMIRYALRLDNQVAARRLGFWLELLELADDTQLIRLEKGVGHSYSYLEPVEMAKGPLIIPVGG